jgi:hypothetical protein
MEADPGEMNNLAGDSAYRDILQSHRAMLDRFRKTTNDPFPA